MNGLEMTLDIRFNRKLSKKDYVVPGGYEMVFDGRNPYHNILACLWSAGEYT